MHNRQWTVNVTPSHELIAQQQSLLPTITLLTGILLTMLVSFSVYISLLLAQRSRLLKQNAELLAEQEREREQLIEELMRSNQELARFAYICSHDLQEPLRMITSFTGLLENKMRNVLEQDQKAKQWWQFVTDGAQRAQSLIADILQYASFEAETQSAETVDLNVLIKQIEQAILLKNDSEESPLSYPILPIVQGYPIRLYQLFNNLINNGLKFQAEGAIAHIDISVQEYVDHWQFAISDNGIGIEERFQEKIFEVFQRLHNRSEYPGTGMGLAICKKVVELHDGKIWLESSLGEGTTFYFTLAK